MRKYVSTLLASAAAIMVVASVASVASAADMPVKAAPRYVPPPPPPPDWSGVYVGLAGGYGWGDKTYSGTLPWNADPFSLKNNAHCVAGPCSTGSFFEGAFQYFLLGFTEGYPTTGISKVNQDGWIFGGFAGAQKQWGSTILGIEADFDGTDIKGTSTQSGSTAISFDNGIVPNTSGNDPIKATNTASMTSKIDMLGSVRGKIGWAISPNWAIGATGGLGWAHQKDELTQTNSVRFCDEYYDAGQCIFDSESRGGLWASAINRTASAGTTLFGWTAGAYVDYKWQIDANSAVVFGVQYLHYDFPEHSVTFQTTGNNPIQNFVGGGGTTYSVNAKDRIDTVKARISWLFSIH